MDRTDRSELLKASYVSGTGQWSSFGYLLYSLQYIMSCFLIAKPHAKPHAKLLTESSHDRQASCRVFCHKYRGQTCTKVVVSGYYNE